jgi:hypothetical protein
MSPLLRAALAWILVLALPMQTLAAATMLHCGQGAAPRATAPSQVHAGHFAAVAEHVQAADGHHHKLDGGDASAGDAHQCSACAACVAGPALPSSFVIGSPRVPDGAVLVTPLLRDTAVVPARLERPPQRVLA